MSGAARTPEETVGDVRDVAAGWFARQRAGDMSEAERLALRDWLDADPDHRVAYASIRRAWGGSAALRADPLVLEIREHWAASHRRRRRGAAARTVAGWLLAAVVAASAGGLGWHLSGPHPLADQSFRTAVGQRSTVKLPDGSELTLNTDTVVRTRADRDRRLVYLERGQAFFRVAKDRDHPFVVAAAGRTVTAVGTAFDVRVGPGGLKVTLVEGKVRVEAPLPQSAVSAPGQATGPDAGGKAVSVQAADMTAGSQLVATAQTPWRVAPANVIVETSWTRGLLIFDNQPLSDVLAELNRYSNKKIVMADPAIASIPVSGTFRPGDVDSFVRTVQAYRLARAGEDTAEAVQLHAY